MDIDTKTSSKSSWTGTPNILKKLETIGLGKYLHSPGKIKWMEEQADVAKEQARINILQNEVGVDQITELLEENEQLQSEITYLNDRISQLEEQLESHGITPE
jgi:hypothetical protein